jgi:hypothetical protein
VWLLGCHLLWEMQGFLVLVVVQGVQMKQGRLDVDDPVGLLVV